jgi:hypothetical protein
MDIHPCSKWEYLNLILTLRSFSVHWNISGVIKIEPHICLDLVLVLIIVVNSHFIITSCEGIHSERNEQTFKGSSRK